MWYGDLVHVQAGGDGGGRSLTQMVVIHATDNTASAASEASYAQTRPDGTSAHFYVDEAQVIQALDTSHIAFGCYPMGNMRSIQFELCGLSNAISDATMRRAAPIVARVCADWGIPIRKINAADLVASVEGICGHADVTAAWHQGDHTDPGSSFPWGTFISYVQEAANPPTPAPPTEEEGMHNVLIDPGYVFDRDAAGNDLSVPNWDHETKFNVPAWGFGSNFNKHGAISVTANARCRVELMLGDGGAWHLIGTADVDPTSPARIAFDGIKASANRGCVVSCRPIKYPGIDPRAETANIFVGVETLPD